MKYLCTLLLFIGLVFQGFSQKAINVNHLILPVPANITQGTGYFEISPAVKITTQSSNKEVHALATTLAKKIQSASGLNLQVQTSRSNQAAKSIELQIVNSKELGEEGYRLAVNTNKVVISAARPAGLFYGIQSLYQLMPKEIEGSKVAKNIAWNIPVCTITDNPRFGWRGLMLDVSRHFFTKDEVKGFIDEMVKYKFNVLHWHLTDDQGWRIEIKGWPRLTEFGAWNVKKEGYFGTFSKPSPDEPRDYGGFYTQEDIKEIVQYARDRFVNILPEIDVPGHSLATVASYPELSCTAEASTYQVNSGESFMDWSHGAPPIALEDNTLCPANEKVYAFLNDVFTQVAALFPFEYIHAGGDEAPHNYWEKDPQIQALMKREKLTTMNEVQSYFTKRVEKIIESKGKKLIGWDEILEGGLAPNAAVMSWRGIDGGIKASQMGHEVVMSPTTFAYLDYMQGDPAIESKVYATLRLKKAYEFNPLPEGVDPKFIKGGQANLWTEQIYNTRYMQYMMWPRGMAIAESVWSPSAKKDWNNFIARVENQLPRLDAANVKYAPSMYEPVIEVSKNQQGKLNIALSTEVNGIDIYYSFDNSFPDNYYPKYATPITPPVDAVQLKIVTYRGDKQVGRFITIPVSELQKRASGK